MFSKITSGTALEEIITGALIVKFPLDGQVCEEIDLSNEEKFQLFEVDAIHERSLTLRLIDPAPEMPVNDLAKNRGDSPEQNRIKKNFSALDNESIWWWRPTDFKSPSPI